MLDFSLLVALAASPMDCDHILKQRMSERVLVMLERIWNFPGR
jgi:hypothetical protein